MYPNLNFQAVLLYVFNLHCFHVMFFFFNDCLLKGCKTGRQNEEMKGSKEKKTCW